MATYVFPSSQTLFKIEQEKLPTLTQDDPIFDYFPITSKPTIDIRFEQRDNYTGLQQLRGVGGEPNRVVNVGAKSFLIPSGVYGEYKAIDEKEMLERRPLGTWEGYVEISDLVMDAQDQLLTRRLDRIRWIMWTLLTTGTFSVSLPGGAVGHTDSYATVSTIGQYGMQTASSAVAWSTFATATPLQDFRTMKLLARGRSISFGPGSDVLMNQTTFNRLVRNTNAGDFGGKKAMNSPFGTITSLADVNKIFLDADLPTVRIHDGGYIDDSGNFQLFIPTGTAILVGKRVNGDPLGNYIYTRNMVNQGGASGPYQRVYDYTQGPTAKIPPKVEVHDGHNGGPALYYPSAIVRLTTG